MLLDLIGQKRGQGHYGEELRESEHQKAERLIGEALSKGRRVEADLKRRRKGDPGKARMAARLREETTMTWLWIAKSVKHGTDCHYSRTDKH